MRSERSLNGFEVAVIGMSGRFPGAKSIQQFWDNLKNGVESISFFSDEELIEAGISPEALKNPNFVKAKGYIEDIEYFDAGFFGYTPAEAAVMDPQLRLLHECSWEALEDGGYNPEMYGGLISLYLGGGLHLTWLAQLLSMANSPSERFEIDNLNTPTALCTRISHKLNLRGSSLVIDTACSTSLVAIHLAVRALLSGECDMALAGGVSIKVPKKSGYMYQEGMIKSPDGHCRAFDAKANGTSGGDGVGLVLLKSLEDALADGDHIYAVIKGSAINNDGVQKIGFTAPGVIGQSEVIRAALTMAEVDANSIGYVETHGTGTILGDPIEIEALKQAFATDQKKYCPIGSVKSNIGHLDKAAGVAGFIKTVLSLKHKVIPPSINYETPNPTIDFENSPFFVNTELREWSNERYPLRAGVSSFGIGGTNAHVVLEEAMEVEKSSSGREWCLIPLSAKNQAALNQATENLCNFFRSNPQVNLADAAYTMQIGRKEFKYRRMIVASNVEEAIINLQKIIEKPFIYSARNEKPIILIFSGQGSQYVNMGLELYQKEPAFKEEMDHCLDIVKSLKGQAWVDELKATLYPEKISKDEAKKKIRQQDFAQPIIYIFEYALAKLLLRWGIKPYAMIGYSIGEYVAATLAGVISLEDALRLLIFRGDLVKDLPEGSMLSVPLTEEELLPLLEDDISLAIDNGPSCIVSGPVEVIRKFKDKLKEHRILSLHLDMSHATHSKEMEPILEKFAVEVRNVRLNQPEIPYISSITGNWISPEEATDHEYWVRNIREKVRFADGLTELSKVKNAIFVEVGPGRNLSLLVRRHLEDPTNERIVNLIRPGQSEVSDLSYFLASIGQLWRYGIEIDWAAFYENERRKRVSLPTYPFQKNWYWMKQTNQQERLKGVLSQHAESEGLEYADSVEEVAVSNPDYDTYNRPDLSSEYHPPRDPLEERLVFLWEEYFGISMIGIDDDFFEIGGDSLKAVTIVTKVQKEFGVKLALLEIYENPTIRVLSEYIRKQNGELSEEAPLVI